MAQPFTNEQRDAIRKRLFDSACRHALTPGLKKTSLDALTADAGISKSSFYKFYQSKEELFLEVASFFERHIIDCLRDSLEKSRGESSKIRAASAVMAAFREIHAMGIARFLQEDLPELAQYIPRREACSHYLTSADVIFSSLRSAQIRFTASDEIVLSSIQLLYLSILNIGDLGASFFPALHELVIGACNRLVA